MICSMYRGGARKEGLYIRTTTNFALRESKVSAATSPLLTTSPLISPLFSPLLSFGTLLGTVVE